MALIFLLFYGLPTFLGVLATFVILKLQRRKAYFEKCGVPYLGSGWFRTLRLMTGFLNMASMEQELHREAVATGAPIVGITEMSGHAAFYLTDVEMVKQVVVKDFEHFVNRRPILSKGSKGWFAKVLFFMEDEQWKGFRAKMSPAFTTGKIRKMFEIFGKSSGGMEQYILRQLENNCGELEFTRVFSKYSMDVIASCAFGIDSKSWEGEPGQQSTFEKMGHRFGFDFSGKLLLKMLVMQCAPKVAEMLGLDILDREAAQYYAEVVRSVIKHRRQTGTRQQDFLQLMLDAQQGLLNGDEEAEKVMMGNEDNEAGASFTGTGSKISFEDDDIVANGMLFLMAGFGPTQSSLLGVLHVLATKPEIQRKLFEEIYSNVEENGGKLTYETMAKMGYLEMVINETLRYLPLAGRAERLCTKNYRIPGTEAVIQKGTLVVVPISGLHKDPRFYPNPEQFIPERFSAESKAERPQYSFLPFGHGPRNCLGMRFSIIKMKAAICHLVLKFEFAPCSRTQSALDFGNSFVKPKGGLWLGVRKR